MKSHSKLHTCLSVLLLAVGLLEPVGYMTGIGIFEELGYISVSSPLPIVFTDRAGMEDFASRYTLSWTRKDDGKTLEKEITSTDFARLSGPFNRRGVYATAIGYPPRLSARLWKPVLLYGFCRSQVLGMAIGETSPLHSFQLTLSTRTEGRNDQWNFQVNCPSQ